jgi:uncharacterized protein YbaP (TraB family)
MDADNLSKLVSAMTYDDDRTLEKLLGKALYERLAALLAKLGLPDTLAQKLKPWAALSFIIVPPRPNVLPMDMVLYQAAGKAGKKQASLETIEEQVALFDNLNPELQVEMLREVVQSFGEVTELAQKMVDAYLDRNLDQLDVLSNDERFLRTEQARRFDREFKELTINRRNVVMAGRLEPLLKAQATFVAVGALHLPGDRGLLALLERNGYRISRADK